MEINKPLAVERQEVADKLCSVLNESSLPKFVLQQIVKDLYDVLAVAAKNEYEKELTGWLDAVNADKKEDKTNGNG